MVNSKWKLSLTVVGLLGITGLVVLLTVSLWIANLKSSEATPANSALPVAAVATSSLSKTLGATPSLCAPKDDPKDNPKCANAKATYLANLNQELSQRTRRPDYTPYIPNYTPIKFWPEPDSAKVIKLIPRENYGTPGWTGYAFFKNATTVWRNGAIPAADYTDWYDYYSWSGPDPTSEDGAISIGGFTYNAPREVVSHYNRGWKPPENLGDITITAVNGPDGVISFKGSNGKSGTLDLKTEKWVINP